MEAEKTAKKVSIKNVHLLCDSSIDQESDAGLGEYDCNLARVSPPEATGDTSLSSLLWPLESRHFACLSLFLSSLNPDIYNQALLKLAHLQFSLWVPI